MYTVNKVRGAGRLGKADGSQQRSDTKLTRILRAAMAEAGVGIEYATYKCRRSGCGFQEVFESELLERDCHCGYKLLAVPKVAAFRWYDLRHMCATFHDRAGAKPMAVSLLLGHSVPGITQGRYTHLRPEDMFHELNRWRLPF